jgi:hypothetical protein
MPSNCGSGPFLLHFLGKQKVKKKTGNKKEEQSGKKRKSGYPRAKGKDSLDKKTIRRKLPSLTTSFRFTPNSSAKTHLKKLPSQLMQDYLKGLNDRQQEAVLAIDGPLMIVAGAGSGKTKVLTTRIAHLMAQGVDAFNILALTFTNKAAAEMKERIGHILGNREARNLYIGTFHSVFARIMRAEAHRIGYPNSFTIYDTDDAKSVVKAVTNELNLDVQHYKPNVVYNRISSAKIHW